MSNELSLQRSMRVGLEILHISLLKCVKNSFVVDNVITQLD